MVGIFEGIDIGYSWIILREQKPLVLTRTLAGLTEFIDSEQGKSLRDQGDMNTPTGVPHFLSFRIS